MDRKVFIIILFVASSYFGKAQINQKEYNQLIDYVNCKYVGTYIDKKRSEIAKNPGGDKYLNDFDKRKKAFDKDVTVISDIYNGFDKNQRNSTSIYEALRKSANGWEKAKLLWQYVDDKKKKFSKRWTTEQVINSAISLSDDAIKISGKPVNYKTFLNRTTTQVKEEVIRLLKKETTETDQMDNEKDHNGDEEETIVRNKTSVSNSGLATVDNIPANIGDTAQLTSGNEPAKQKQKEVRTRSQYNSKFLIVIVVIVSLFLAYYKRKWILLFLKKHFPGNISNKQPELVAFLNKINELEDELANSKSFIHNLESEKAELKSKVKNLEHQLNHGKTQNNNTSDNSRQINDVLLVVEPRQTIEKLNQIGPKRLYADAIINSEFHRTTEQPDSDTVYELRLLESLRKATFSVFVGAYQRVLKNADFVDGCDKQKLASPPQDIEVENGIAEQDDLGKWRITKKAIVKFI